MKTHIHFIRLTLSPTVSPNPFLVKRAIHNRKDTKLHSEQTLAEDGDLFSRIPDHITGRFGKPSLFVQFKVFDPSINQKTNF